MFYQLIKMMAFTTLSIFDKRAQHALSVIINS